MGRKSKADVRKQEILMHFYEVLKTEGFENASIAKIAQHMDVNPSLLIHYFRNKEEMVVEVVDFLLQQYENAFLGQVTKFKEPEKRFQFVINLLFGVEWVEIIDHSVFYGCYYLGTRHERILDRFRQMYLKFREYLSTEAAIWLEYKLVAKHQPEELAEYLIASLEGLVYYGHIFRDKARYAAHAEFTKKMLLRSLQPD